MILALWVASAILQTSRARPGHAISPDVACAYVLLSSQRNPKSLPVSLEKLRAYATERKFDVKNDGLYAFVIDPKLIEDTAAEFDTLGRHLPVGAGQRVVQFSALGAIDRSGFNRLFEDSPMREALLTDEENPDFRIVISPAIRVPLKTNLGRPDWPAWPFDGQVPKGGETPNLLVSKPTSALNKPAPTTPPGACTVLCYATMADRDVRARQTAKAFMLLAKEQARFRRAALQRLSDAIARETMGQAKLPAHFQLRDLPPMVQSMLRDSMDQDWKMEGFPSQIAGQIALQNADLGGLQFSLEFSVVGQEGPGRYIGSFGLDNFDN